MFLVLGISLGLMIGTMVKMYRLRSEAVQRGFAQRNRTNGCWEWKGYIEDGKLQFVR